MSTGKALFGFVGVFGVFGVVGVVGVLARIMVGFEILSRDFERRVR